MEAPLCTVTAFGGWSLDQLKDAVEANSSWSVHKQRLFDGTRELCEVLLQAEGRSDKLSDLLDHPCDGDVPWRHSQGHVALRPSVLAVCI